MTKQNIIEKCEGSEIQWKDGKDVTKKKIKKKQKNKKNNQNRTITKTVEQESFFNFFKTIAMPDEKELAAKAEAEGADEEGQKDVGEQMDEDFDIGNEFKDQLIPLALEYYLEVIEDEEEGDDECCDSDDDHHHHHDKDSDDDKPAKGGKGGKKKGGAAAGGKDGQ